MKWYIKYTLIFYVYIFFFLLAKWLEESINFAVSEYIKTHCNKEEMW